MAQQFNVEFTGRFKPGFTEADVIRAFADRFKLDEEQAAAMLRPDTVTILKKATDWETATRMQAVLEEIGIIVKIRPEVSQNSLALVPTEDHADDTFAGDEPAADDSPEQAIPEPPARAVQSFNPYAKAAPERQAQTGDGGATPLSQRVFEGSVTVPASRGISWITEGYSRHVSKNLGAWIGAILVYFVIMIVLTLIPFIGSIALMLLGPVIVAGFMIGAKEQAEGGDFTVSHLFSAVDQHLGQLMMVALLYLVAAIVMMVIGFAMVALFGLSLYALADPQAATMPGVLSLLLIVLVMLLLMLPLMAAYWFAPALVALEGLSAFDALKHSFIGCLKNILPMLVYGLLGMVLFFVAAIPLFLGLILLAPVMMASIYVSYKDIFRSEEALFSP